MPGPSEESIKQYYREEATKHGASRLSTMEDEVVREKELELLRGFLTVLGKDGTGLRVLDLGCGNGYALEVLSGTHSHSYWGLDICRELLTIAQARNLPNCVFSEGSALAMPFGPDFFDLVYTERCLINILDWEEQQSALGEIARVLRPGGYYLMIECFTDGLANNNQARQECGLEELKEAPHNKYFQKELFFQAARGLFSIIEPARLDPDGGGLLFSPNFLSSHYFIARVLHPLVTKGAWVRNTEFVKFFTFLPPVGNYSPLQAFILQKPNLSP